MGLMCSYIISLKNSLIGLIKGANLSSRIPIDCFNNLGYVIQVS